MTSEAGWQHQTNEQQEYDYDHDLHTAWCNVAMGLATDYAEAYCNHQCDDTKDNFVELGRTRRELKRHLFAQPASMMPASVNSLREIETPADPEHMPDYVEVTAQLPQGYEPHELPADYTGPLWIEGQMRQFENAVRERDTALLRQALEAMEATLSGADYDNPYATLKAAADALRARLKDTHANISYTRL